MHSHDDPSHLEDADMPLKPRPDPCTVITLLPVEAEFLDLIELINKSDDDSIALKLPAARPTVTTKSRVLIAPARPIPPLTDVSDFHTVKDDALHVPDDDSVSDSSPKPIPYTVTMVEPVLLMLEEIRRLAVAELKDRLMLKVPERTPAVRITRWLPLEPRPVLHKVIVSDTHAEDSNEEPPFVKDRVCENTPELCP